MKKLFLNYKSHLNLDDINILLNNLDNENIVVCPSDIYLMEFIKHHFVCCAQNVSAFEEGNYTGETAASQLKSIGVRYVMVGHFERIKFLNENKKNFIAKINNATKNDLKVVLCIESLSDIDILKEISKIDNIILAYEPSESIGTKYVKDLKEIEKNIANIKEIIYNSYGYNIMCLYGGSVDENNIEKLNSISCIDGFVICSAALDAQKLLKIEEVVLNK